MSTHVSAVVKASFAALRRIRSVRRSIPRRALLTLIQALVVSKVDYCNSLPGLSGLSDTLLRWLQSVLNAAARLVFSARKSEHITPLLRELHWLRVPERIKFRLCVLGFRCIHGTAQHTVFSPRLCLTRNVMIEIFSYRMSLNCFRPVIVICSEALKVRSVCSR